MGQLVHTQQDGILAVTVCTDLRGASSSDQPAHGALPEPKPVQQGQTMPEALRGCA